MNWMPDSDTPEFSAPDVTADAEATEEVEQPAVIPSRALDVHEKIALQKAARAALLEMTPENTIGDLVDERDEGGDIVTMYFSTEMVGYPGWRWTVSVSFPEGQEPSVLETELTPGDGALLAPDWVPWSDRLADYKAAQENESEESDDDADHSEDDEDDESDVADDESDDEDDDESDDEEESDDDDDLGSDILHGGDLDGVDIDEADVPEPESDDESGDESDDDEEQPGDDDEEHEKTY